MFNCFNLSRTGIGFQGYYSDVREENALGSRANLVSAYVFMFFDLLKQNNHSGFQVIKLLKEKEIVPRDNRAVSFIGKLPIDVIRLIQEFSGCFFICSQVSRDFREAEDGMFISLATPFVEDPIIQAYVACKDDKSKKSVARSVKSIFYSFNEKIRWALDLKKIRARIRDSSLVAVFKCLRIRLGLPSDLMIEGCLTVSEKANLIREWMIVYQTQLSEIKSLSLSSLSLYSLPFEMRCLSGLQSLDLSNNKLNRLPEWLVDFKQLEALDVSGNEIENLMDLVGKLPNLKEIRWSFDSDTLEVKKEAGIENLITGMRALLEEEFL